MQEARLRGCQLQNVFSPEFYQHFDILRVLTNSQKGAWVKSSCKNVRYPYNKHKQNNENE